MNISLIPFSLILHDILKLSIVENIFYPPHFQVFYDWNYFIGILKMRHRELGTFYWNCLVVFTMKLVLASPEIENSVNSLSIVYSRPPRYFPVTWTLQPLNLFQFHVVFSLLLRLDLAFLNRLGNEFPAKATPTFW